MSEELLAIQVQTMMNEIISLRYANAEKNVVISNLKKTLHNVVKFCEGMGYSLIILQGDGSEVNLSSTDKMFE